MKRFLVIFTSMFSTSAFAEGFFGVGLCMKRKLIMTLLMLGLGAPLFAQGGVATGKGAYPKITAEDLASCRKEIAELHREEINYLKIDADKYCVNSHKNDHPDNCKNAKKWVSESSSENDLAWFMKGNKSCADGYVCYGLSTYNENPDESFINTILKTTVPVFDAGKVRAEWREDNSDEKSDSPQEEIYYENKHVQEVKLYGLALAADKCIAKIWVANRDGKTSVATAEKQPGKKLAENSKQINDGGAMSPAAGANKVEMAASTGGPEYVRIQSNKKCAAYKVTETPDAVSKFKKVVFGIKNTCDIPMYIRWSVYEGKHETLSVDFPLQRDLTPSRNAYFKPGETLISKPFSVLGHVPVKIVFNQVCPIESEASRIAGKPLGNIQARPEQPDLCIGLVLKPTDVPTAK